MLRHRHLSGLIAFIFLLLPSVSYAQLVGGEVFFQGDFVEVGMSNNGAFGTDQDAPAGYHPRGGITRPNKLGFVADPDKDGWAVGTPNYIGDFFVPGSPQEGWDMLVGTNWAQAWSAASFSGGLTGTCTGYISTTTSMTGVWEGTLGDLKITQSTKLKKDKLYFTSVVKIVNKGATTLYNFYYDRTVDPDNEKEVPPSAGSTYDTKNKIVYALPSAGNKTLVTAVGTRYSSYLGLGSRDCRAKPYVVLGGLTPTDTLDKLYSGTGTTNARFTVGEENTSDVGIGIVFKIDSLRPGDSTVLSYAYVLSEKDLDSAFEDLKPVLNINGKPFMATDTIKACVGSVLNIDVINADYYNWSWSPSTGISPTRGARVSITVGTSEITYTADPSSTMCPIDPLKLTIVPIPNPAAPAAPSPLFYCQHEVAPPMTGSPAPGGSLRWYTTPAGGTPVMSMSPVTNIVGARSYYVSQVSAQGCESERTEVVVNTRPLPVLDGFSSKSPTACAAKDGTISFRVDGANSTYTIFFDKDGGAGTPVVFTSDATGRFTLTGMGGGSYTYFYVVDKNGCKSLPYIGPVDLIDPIPDGPPIVNNGPLCVGGKLELTAPFLDGVTYKWTGPNGFSSTDRSPELEDVTEASGGDYVLIVTKGTCVYRASRTTLEIAPTPKHQQFSPKALCEGTDLKVELLREPGTSYAWTGHGVNQFDQDLLVSPVSLEHSGYYLVTATSGVGCITLDSVEVRVDKKQTVSYGGDTSICSGDFAQLFVQTDGADVLWSPAGSLDNATALTPKASPTTKTEYQVVAHSGTTCPDITGKVSVDVIPAPSVRAYDTLVRMDVPYTIMPVYGQDAVKWHWEPADNLSCSDCPNPVFTSRNDMTYTVYVSNNLGCTSADTVTIRVFCDGASVTMPNAFTPNGDGKNDLYYVRGKGFAVKRFIIYNRLGQEVFHKENFLPNDKNYGWDGTLSGTQITEAAGFVYMLEVQCYGSTNEPMVMKGTVLLIR